jgi:ABC-2 type transport system permease protein
MFPIFRKELNSFFNSLIAYISIGVFLLLTWLFVWFYEDSNVLDYGFADLNIFFSITPYIFLLLIPAITMRSFADEFKAGTIEILFTKPLSDWQIILGKYFATFVIIILAVFPTIIYYFSIKALGNPPNNIDSAAVVGSYIGLLLLGACFASISLWASSITDNQVVAFILGATLCYFFYDGFMQLSNVFNGTLQYYIQSLSLSHHYNALGRGLIDLRNVLYLVSIIFLMLYLIKIKFEKLKN